MRSSVIVPLLALLAAPPAVGLKAPPDRALVEVRSRFTVAETLSRLENVVAARGLTLFARVDHARNAAGAGLVLPPAVLLVVGNAAVGTRVMQCDPRVAVELPLRLLVREDPAGAVWVGYADPRPLADRYRLADCTAVLERMAAALDGIAREAAGDP